MPRLFSLVVALPVVGLVMVGAAQAQSFNCQNVTAPDERAICSDPELGQLDEAMAADYARALDYLRDRFPGAVAGLRQDQRKWLRTRRACGRDRDCLIDAYEMRSTVLRRLTSGAAG